MTLKQKVFVASLVFVVFLNVIVFIFLKKTFKTEQTPRPAEIKAKIAIVIDDWGYNLECMKFLRQMDAPITVSVLPHLGYSLKVAQVAQNLGQEVILHLPLEPDLKGREGIGLEKDTITSSMDDQTVRAVLSKALDNIAFAVGVSNHMGSLATKDRRLMEIIFDEMKKRKLFFLDNRVIGDSICRTLSRQMQVPCAVRDVFLDNKNDKEYIRGQLHQLQAAALANGKAVGVGHARLLTLEVLTEEIPLMRAKGIAFVPVSALME